MRQRIIRVEDAIARLDAASARIGEVSQQHIIFCTERERLRDEQHADNKKALAGLADSIDSVKRTGLMVLLTVSGTLLTVIGWIIAQAVHFHATIS